MKNIIIYLLIFYPITLFSQKIDAVCTRIDKIGYNITDVSIEFYKENSYIKER